MTMWILRFLALLVVLCVIAWFCLYAFQEKLVFMPHALKGYETPDKNPEGFRSPKDYGVPFLDVAVESTGGVVLHAWFMKQAATTTCPTIIFLQGNAGNMGFRLPNLVEMYKLLGCNVIAPSYRGYGWSSGVPSEQGLVDDAIAVLEHFLGASPPVIDPKSIFVFGRSLGGAVSFQLAAKRGQYLTGVIVENTFFSIREMAALILPPFKIIPGVLDRMLRVQFASGEIVPRLELPVLFIAGTSDVIVPPSQMSRLFAACGSKSKWLLTVHGGSHNDTWQRSPPKYYHFIKCFMQACVDQVELPRVECLDIGDPHSAGLMQPRGPKFFETLLRQLPTEQDAQT